MAKFKFDLKQHWWVIILALISILFILKGQGFMGAVTEGDITCLEGQVLAYGTCQPQPQQIDCYYINARDEVCIAHPIDARYINEPESAYMDCKDRGYYATKEECENGLPSFFKKYWIIFVLAVGLLLCSMTNIFRKNWSNRYVIGGIIISILFNVAIYALFKGYSLLIPILTIGQVICGGSVDYGLFFGPDCSKSQVVVVFTIAVFIITFLGALIGYLISRRR